MNKKNRLYLLILIVLIVIFFLTKMGKKTEVKTSFFTIAPSEISSIRIESQKDTIVLAQENEKWFIKEPFQFPAQQRKIDDFFEKVLPVQYSQTPLSESENSHTDFNVSDSLGTILTMFDKNGKAAETAIIGKSNNYHYANARRKGEKNVYQLSANITHNINPVLSSWRNREILALTTEQIKSIEIAYDKKMYSLTPADTVWIYESGKETMEVKSEQKQLKDIITSLQAYNASDFVDFKFNEYEKDFAKPVLELKINTYDFDTLHLAYVETENNRYVVQKNGETDHLFIVYKNLVEKFMKSKSDFES